MPPWIDFKSLVFPIPLNPSPFQIATRPIGGEHPTLIIAEVAQAHEGSVNIAHSFIDAAADAGADAIKFQTHIAHAESSPAEEWRVRFSKQDVTRYAYWERMEFTKEQWLGLKDHAESRNLLFLSSPFSLEAVDLLLEIGIPAWKIASGEVRNELLLARMLRSRLPVLLSSGMSAWEELEQTVQRLREAAVPFLVMQCTSAYPCPPERVGLNLIREIRERFGCDSGLSDHSGTIFPALAAVAHGAKAVEVHVTFDRAMFGPDAVASITFAELKTLVEGIRFTERMLVHPIDKDREAGGLGGMRKMFSQSLVAAVDLAKGTVLEERHLGSRKPQNGVPASELHRVLGKRLRKALRTGEVLQESDLEILS